MTREEAIREVVRKIVEYCHPERIYFFGSAARGDEGPDSDLDFCVVLPDDAPEELLRSNRIYASIGSVGYSKGIIPWRSTNFDARAEHVVASLPATIKREGRLLYDGRRAVA